VDEKTVPVTVRRSVHGWSAYEGDDIYKLISSAETIEMLVSFLLRLGISEFTVKVLPEERTEPWPQPKKKVKPRRRLGVKNDDN
jgi:hypothetical protein